MLRLLHEVPEQHGSDFQPGIVPQFRMIEHDLGNHGREMLEVRGHGALGDTAQVALKGLSDRLEHGLRPVYWNAVRDIGTEDAVRAYLHRYPNGRFRREANLAIQEIRLAGQREVQQIETRLELSRESRREIQRNLALLGFDPRGIDGVFGQGSRKAIASWQRSRGLEAHGYLNANQIRILDRAAGVRAAQIEAEARRRQEELERADSAYWRQTGQQDTETGLRTYLHRYPDGQYSDIAREKLRIVEKQRRQSAAVAERSAWDRAATVDSAQEYRAFLTKYPSGGFSEAARARLAELEQESRDQAIIQAAKAEEAKIANNSVTRLLVERQLARLQLKPGKADGEFTRETRKALRKFQRARDIPVTGYVTQQTLVQLLASL